MQFLGKMKSEFVICERCGSRTKLDDCLNCDQWEKEKEDQSI